MGGGRDRGLGGEGGAWTGGRCADNKEEEVSIGPAEKAPIPGKRGEAT